MLEVLLVIVVGVALIIGGVVVYNNIQLSNKTNETIRLIQQIKQETKNIYSGYANYGPVGGGIEQTLISMNVIPDEYINASGSIDGPYSGSIDVFVVAAGLDRFLIRLWNVPLNLCASLAANIDYNDPDLVFMRVGDHSTLTTVTDPATIVPLCVAEDNQILLAYR